MPCEVWNRIIGEAFLGSGQESNNQKQHLSRVNLGAVMWVELTEDKVKVKKTNKQEDIVHILM